MARLWLALITVVLMSLGSALPAAAAPVTLAGEVSYAEPIALPPGATLRVSLVDLSQAVTVRVSASSAIAERGRVPLSFRLDFDSRLLQPDHQYGLFAEIRLGEAVWFRNAKAVPVDPLAGHRVTLSVAFLGKIVDRESLIAAAASPPPIVGRNWQATEILSLPVLDGTEVTLSIADDMRAGGRSGCNSYFVQVEFEGEALLFDIAATRMGCSVPITAQELAFFGVLQTARSWRLLSDHLSLLGPDGTTLAEFTAGKP